MSYVTAAIVGGPAQGQIMTIDSANPVLYLDIPINLGPDGFDPEVFDQDQKLVTTHCIYRLRELLVGGKERWVLVHDSVPGDGVMLLAMYCAAEYQNVAEYFYHDYEV